MSQAAAAQNAGATRRPAPASSRLAAPTARPSELVMKPPDHWDYLARAIVGHFAPSPGRDRLSRELEALPEEERAILELRFGLVDGLPRSTLQQVADRMGLTPERVRQLEAQALRRLRRDR